MTCAEPRKAIRNDLIGFGLFTFIVSVLAIKFDGFEHLLAFIKGKGDVDEIFTVLIFLPIVLVAFSCRRWTELRKEMKHRLEAETEILRQNEELRVARIEADSANVAKSEFLANMSHEIRTPLNGVLGMTELVLDSDLNAEQRDFLLTAYQSAETLLSVINDILDFSKVESGKMEVEDLPLDIRELVELSTKSLALSAHQKKLEIACYVDEGVPQVIRGDITRLRQVLCNLLGNAIKFTQHGEIILRVAPIETDSGRMLHFTVRDTGMGVAPEKREKIFDAFSQADSSITRKFGGSGLGLAIASRIVKLMGGTIWLESEIGSGSLFNFTIPMVAAPPLAVPPEKAALKDLIGKHVLVVDDNFTNRQILEKLLAPLGMRVSSVEDGPTALRTLSQAKVEGDAFEVLLVDFQMPGMDGIELARRIRSSPEYSDPIIMMLTSDDFNVSVSKVREFGIAAHLVKPIRQGELITTIRQVVGWGAASDPKAEIVPHRINRAPEGLRVLLAEDNLVNQKLAIRLLEKMGHVVTLAVDGRQALAYFDNHSFDLILMDVQMPEMDGIAVSKAIRETERHTGSHTPIIAMTAHALEGDRDRCLDAGMDDYLSKPINAEKLANTIQRCLDAQEVDLRNASR